MSKLWKTRWAGEQENVTSIYVEKHGRKAKNNRAPIKINLAKCCERFLQRKNIAIDAAIDMARK